MNTPSLFATFSDDDVIAETKRLVACERTATAALLQSLMEIDTRRLYLREGCSSLFTYCTQVLHLAEGAAYNRIEAARAAKRFPEILQSLSSGAVTLTTIRLLAPHLTDANHGELLEASRHKSKREIERLVVALKPRPAAPTVIRKVSSPGVTVSSAAAVAQSSALAAPGAPTPASVPVSVNARPATGERTPDEEASPHRAQAETRLPPAVTPLSFDRYKLQVTISRETHDKLCHAQDLLRHTHPSGDVSALIDRALTLLVADLERRRCAATPAPRASGTHPGTSTSRHIRAAVRRQVWQRDQGRCAFVGTNGRCTETAFLEFHHVVPHVDGGLGTIDNIQLRCRAHNLYEASLFFGDGADRVRECARMAW